jgi:beta-glucosidase
VKNTGDRDADEIAQLYLSPTTDSQHIRPIQLQGFARVSLKAGQTKTVRVKMYTEQFGYYTHNGERQWNIAPGTFTLKVGASSQDIRLQQNITLTGSVVEKKLRDYYFSESTVK